MTSRERGLLVVFLGAVVVIGGGGAFHFLFLKPYNALRNRMLTAQKDIDAKTEEIKTEEDEIKRAERMDPRQIHWEYTSIPDSPSRDRETLRTHISDERVRYESYLFDLLKESGFQGISTASKDIDSRNVPLYANKLPVYTRLTYTVEAKASFTSIVKMFKAFYEANKLHQIREFKIRKPPLPGGGNRGQRGPAGPGAPGAPGVPNGAVPQVGPDRGATNNILDVNMTVEALIVTGAKPPEARKTSDDKKGRAAAPQRGNRQGPGRGDPNADALGFDGEEAEEQPPAPTAAPVSILTPRRHYEDMLEKNIFTGQRGAEGTVSENPRDVLMAVRLVQIERIENPEAGWFDPPSVWKVEFYDQGSNQRDKYVRCTPDKSEGHTLAVKNNQGEDLDIDHTFAIKDKYGSKTVVKGTVVDANIHGIVVKVDGVYRKMFLGDFFEDVLNPPLAEGEKIPLDPEREPMDKYTRGTWTGLPTRSPEEPSEILKVVTLAKTTDTGRRWEVDFADPVRKREYTCTPDSSVRNSFTIKDRKNVAVLSGTVVDANSLGAVIHIDDHFYKMKTGQSFSDAMDVPPMKTYTRGDWKAPPPVKEEEKKDKEGDKGK